MRSVKDLQEEAVLRARFVESRLGHSPDLLEGMDLTHFMHGGPAEIVACQVCGALRRNEEDTAHYESDQYDPALMRCLYPRYRAAFERKRHDYLPLLPHRAEVLEVGAHLGAFLETAETWGWRPIGLDIGADTSTFARKQGGTVKRVDLYDYSPRSRPDAIFIWNCFEQLSDPWSALFRARELLGRHGLIVLRVPNAEFYRHPVAPTTPWVRAEGYNNLLGFPYLNGYDTGALKRLLACSGFKAVQVFATSLIIPPYPDMTARVRREWSKTRAETERLGPTHGTWIEIVGRVT